MAKKKTTRKKSSAAKRTMFAKANAEAADGRGE
jgi:hypothetical protein